MEQKLLSGWLSTITVIIAICTFLIYELVIPGLGMDMIYLYPECSSWYAPWFIFIQVTSIPCYIALYVFLRISMDIGKDRAFTSVNAIRLKKISFLAGLDSLFFMAGNFIMLILNMNHPGVILISFFICIAGIAISIAAASLSRLVTRAAMIQEENELTI